MLDEHDIVSYLNHGDRRIAFHGIEGACPGLFFMHGFRSDMTAAKATFVAAMASTQGQGFTGFDYFGHGRSDGKFTDGTIDTWLEDSLAVFDQATIGPQILIGSSLGGWLALLLALKRPERVAGVIGIAAAPDFTEDLVWPNLSKAEKATMARTGSIEVRNPGEEPYRITQGLIDSGRRNLLLRGQIGVKCPVRLLHGMADEEVPWQTACSIAERVDSQDVRVLLVKDAHHRLSRESDLDLLKQIINNLISLA